MKKLLITFLSLFLPFSLSAKEELFIYNWSDYIAEDTIANSKQKQELMLPTMYLTPTKS